MLKQPTARVIYYMLSLFSLVCGAAVYPLFRGSNLLIWNIVPKPVFWGMGQTSFPKESIASVLAGSGPDFLWTLSGICVLRGLWYHEPKIQKRYLVFFYLTAAGYNLGQYWHFIPGTFDILDLLTMSGVALAEGIVWTFFIRRERRELK